MREIFYYDRNTSARSHIVKRDTLVIGLWQACSPSVINLRSAGSVGLWEKVLGVMEV
ncbi:unnamed protein product [Malus baccata var. baccata]